MPLEILIILVVGGIAGVAALTHVLGLSAPLTFRSEEEVRMAWLRHRPDDELKGAHISTDGRSALVMTNNGPGLLWSMGADSTARLLTHAEIDADANGLIIEPREFTAPRIRVALSGPDRDAWTQELETARP